MKFILKKGGWIKWLGLVLAMFIILRLYFSAYPYNLANYLNGITSLKVLTSDRGGDFSRTFPTPTGNALFNWIFILLVICAYTVIWIIRHKSLKWFNWIAIGFVILNLGTFYLIYTKYSPLANAETRCSIMPSFFLGEAKDLCFNNLALAKSNSSFCEKIPGNYYYKSQCFYTLAKRNKDSTLCAKILPHALIESYQSSIDFRYSEKNIKDQCYFDFAQKTNSIKFCNDLEQSTKAGCLTELARKTKDIAKCDLIDIHVYGNIYVRRNCYSAMAQDLNKGELCDKVYDNFSDNTSYGRCIEYFVDKTGTTTWCDAVGTSDGRARCVEMAGRIQKSCETDVESLTHKKLDGILTDYFDWVNDGREYTNTNIVSCLNVIALLKKDPYICKRLYLDNPVGKNQALYDSCVK